MSNRDMPSVIYEFMTGDMRPLPPKREARTPGRLLFGWLRGATIETGAAERGHQQPDTSKSSRQVEPQQTIQSPKKIAQSPEY